MTPKDPSMHPVDLDQELFIGAAELERTPLTDSVRRIVLISDGQATEGIRDRDQLAQFAHGIADRGTSITSVGVGLEFDEKTMQRLADQGRGNYYFVENPAKLGSIFTNEIASLSATVASNATLTIDETAGFSIATGLLFAATAKGFGRGPLWKTVPIGIVVSLVIWLIFTLLLKLSLPAGPLEQLFR